MSANPKAHPSCERCATGRIDCSYDGSATGAGPADQTGESSQTREVEADSSNVESNHDRGNLFVYQGGRSTYMGSTFWANAISSEVRHESCQIEPSSHSRAFREPELISICVTLPREAPVRSRDGLREATSTLRGEISDSVLLLSARYLGPRHHLLHANIADGDTTCHAF